MFTKGVREDKIRTVRRNYKQKRHRRGTQDLSRTKACTRASKLHTRYFLLLKCGPRFFHTWNCREERGLTVSFASSLSPCPGWSAHCMRVIATVWALSNRLAHTAGSFLIRSCREFSHHSHLQWLIAEFSDNQPNRYPCTQESRLDCPATCTNTQPYFSVSDNGEL